MEPTLRNPARERLEAGELALGVGIRQSRTVDIAAIMKACGYDWLFLDLEHNSMDLDTAVQISVAALGAGIAPIVRVPAGQFWLATRVLDGGALGIVMPHVDTAEEAREIADRLRYPSARPPLVGRRIAASRLCPDRHRPDLRRDQRRDPCCRHARNPDGDSQCRGDRRRARHRLAADWHQRSVDGARHSRPIRRRADRRRLPHGGRSVPRAWQISPGSAGSTKKP